MKWLLITSICLLSFLPKGFCEDRLIAKLQVADVNSGKLILDKMIGFKATDFYVRGYVCTAIAMSGQIQCDISEKEGMVNSVATHGNPSGLSQLTLGFKDTSFIITLDSNLSKSKLNK